MPGRRECTVQKEVANNENETNSSPGCVLRVSSLQGDSRGPALCALVAGVLVWRTSFPPVKSRGTPGRAKPIPTADFVCAKCRGKAVSVTG